MEDAKLAEKARKLLEPRYGAGAPAVWYGWVRDLEDQHQSEDMDRLRERARLKIRRVFALVGEEGYTPEGAILHIVDNES